MQAQPRRRSSQRGSSLLEFALTMILLTPILLSVVTIGFNTSRAIQVTQVTRDAGSMYARYVDFSLTDNKEVLVRLAQGLGMTLNAGSGVIYLSKVTYISEDDCTAAGLNASTCTNMNRYIIRNRISVGNVAFRSSGVGTPGATSLNGSGDAINPLTDSTLQANTFSSILTLESGQYAYVAESFFQGLAWTVPSTGVGNVLTTRWIF